jgi:hypothetical protein
MSRFWFVAHLARWQQVGLLLLALAPVAFGGVVELRSAFLQHRWTDLDVFLRAAWAVRAGEDPYRVTDDKGLHYHYPPLFAILLTPLADPPAGAEPIRTVPFAVSVALWYAFSWLCLGLAVHRLADALEPAESTAHLPPRARATRWWALRLYPVCACAPAIFFTLALGQVTLLLVLLLGGMATALLRGQGVRAGLWLAGAICLKVIPAFLLVYPLWRRNWRCLGGCAAGLAVGLVLVPVWAFGLSRTAGLYREWADALLKPALALADGGDREEELLATTATHNQAPVAVMHTLAYPDPARRPRDASPGVRAAHWLVGGALTLVTLLAAGRREDRGPAVPLVLGALTLNMLILSPVGHPHYYALLVLLPMGLLAGTPKADAHAGALGWRGVLLAAYALAAVLPALPGFTRLHDWGTTMFAALAVWGVALGRLWGDGRAGAGRAVSMPDPIESRAA